MDGQPRSISEAEQLKGRNTGLSPAVRAEG